MFTRCYLLSLDFTEWPPLKTSLPVLFNQKLGSSKNNKSQSSRKIQLNFRILLKLVQSCLMRSGRQTFVIEFQKWATLIVILLFSPETLPLFPLLMMTHNCISAESNYVAATAVDYITACKYIVKFFNKVCLKIRSCSSETIWLLSKSNKTKQKKNP